VRHNRLLRASALALALAFALAPSVAADRPDTGGRDISKLAFAYFHEAVDDCTMAVLSVRFIAGDNLQVPIGSGKPTSWSDAEFTLDVWDSCTETLAATFFGIGFHPPEIVTFESAILTGVESDLYDIGGDSVHGVIDLYWTGIGKPVTNIIREDDYYRTERAAPAIVSGQVVVDDHSLWGSPLTFAFDEDAGDSATLGWAAQIHLP
jgi:hypothetical protein